jgi:hypothetical protein
VSDATSYTLQEDDNSDFTSPTRRYWGTTSYFQATGQPVGTWYYRVRASNHVGFSPWSNTRSVLVKPLRLYFPLVPRDYSGDTACGNEGDQLGDYTPWSHLPTGGTGLRGRYGRSLQLSRRKPGYR